MLSLKSNSDAPTQRESRGGLNKLIREILNDTKEFLDDTMDKAQDVEGDMRRAARRIVDLGDAKQSPQAGSRGNRRSIDDEEDIEKRLQDLVSVLGDLVQQLGARDRVSTVPASADKPNGDTNP